MAALDVDEATFQREVVDRSAQLPVVVDFWAEWCGPCRTLAPIVETIAEQYGDAARVVKLNVDDNPETAREFGVMSIPTLILFKDGQEKARVVGARGKEAILREIEAHIAA